MNTEEVIWNFINTVKSKVHKKLHLKIYIINSHVLNEA